MMHEIPKWLNYLLYPSRTEVGRDVVRSTFYPLQEVAAFEHATLGYSAVLGVKKHSQHHYC